MERVLEVGEVVFADLARVRDARLADGDPVGQPGFADVGPGTGDRILLEFDADELEGREAPGHRDQPAPAAAVDVDDPSAARQVGDELRQLGERLLEEDGDVLGGQALDRGAVAVGPVADRLARPEEVDHAAPIERGDGGVDELAAEEFGPARIEQDDGHVVVDGQTSVLERRRGRARRPPMPRPRWRSGWQPACAASSVAVRPSRPALRRCSNRPSSIPR